MAEPKTAQKRQRRRCSGKTAKGKRCKAWALTGQKTCISHADKETRRSTGFGGPQPGAGRPRKPRAIEIFRQKVDAEVDAWWQVLVDAREAQRAVVVGDGEHARLEFFDDHPTRLKAFREAMDRVYGRPMQYVDITARADESEVDREISELLSEMDARDPQRAEVAKANGRGR